MNILVDSSVWSLGLRRRKRDLNPLELRAFYAWEKILIAGDATIIGPIRQEVLSGIITEREFEAVKQRLSSVDDLAMSTATFIEAARFYNICRGKGIAPGTVDMMICAAAHEHGLFLFSTDPDFRSYATCLPIRLFNF